MQKKKLHIALSILLCCFTTMAVRAQLTITIPAANIVGQTDYTVTAAPSGIAASLGIAGSIALAAGAANFAATTTGTSTSLPLSVAFIKANTINALSLLGSSTEINLKQTPQTLYTTLVGLGSGALTANYRMAISSNAWLAGTYTAPITFTNVNPASMQLSIVVPAFITLNTLIPVTTAMAITTLAAFRTGGGVSTVNNFDYYTTVPTLLSLQASSSTFSFTTTQIFNSIPSVGANQLNALLSGTYAGSSVNLSIAAQLISISGGIPVILTNKSAFTSTLSISPAALATSFIQAGTYTLPIVYTVAKTSAAYPATLTSGTMNSSVQVVVAKISELAIPTSTVNFNFNSATAYSQGLTVSIPNPVTVSSTVPYGVTVKANGDFTAGINTIPIGVMIVEGAAGQTGVSSLTLTTVPQPLFSSSNPVIDRNINLQFRIPANQTSNLLAKPIGTYNTTITFTIVAP